MSDLEKKFQETAEYVRNWHPTKTVSNDDKLAGYALFKQATIGDCNIPAPGMFNFTEKAKWNAWNALKGMSKEEAMQKYIDCIEAQKVKYA
ncbi:Acyl CoA binding protein [Blastocystis sp. ATCC 50177/Nand II]|uniref:Acyl CoA binding protein n=1 Tax=Blastocystis sp. subtype 1 (strain ATCC 50177 / NandII) TaxID=478820 RepID=A0A196SK71_BLAHN|nr:Acyl CoA binding protein [Blastocystis sp. ATCC 50177/Nand II]